MTIIQTVNEYDFHHAFNRMGRENQFSPAGRQTIYEMLDELSEDIGEPIEFDVIAICCEYTEYTVVEVLEQFEDCKEEIEEDGTVDQDDPEEVAAAVEAWLLERTDARRFTHEEPETGAIVESVIIQEF